MPGAGNTSPTCRWSFRCLPTSGASRRHGTPTASSSACGPMPDSIRTWGEPDGSARRGRPPWRPRRRRSRRRRCGTRRRSPAAARRRSSRITRVTCAPQITSRLGALLDLASEEGVVGARPLAVAGRGLQQRHDPVGAAAVAAVVVALGDAGRHGGVDEVLRAGEHRRPHRHAEGTRGVVGVGVDDDVAARGQALALLEVGQHVLVAPPGGAAGGPRVEVAGMAPHVGHVVDAGRAAEHPAAGHHHPAARRARPAPAGVGRVHPVRRGVLLQRPGTRPASPPAVADGHPPPPERPGSVGSSDSRAATTAPADPPPTTTKSKRPSMPVNVPRASMPGSANRRSPNRTCSRCCAPQVLLHCLAGILTFIGRDLSLARRSAGKMPLDKAVQTASRLVTLARALPTDALGTYGTPPDQPALPRPVTRRRHRQQGEHVEGAGHPLLPGVRVRCSRPEPARTSAQAETVSHTATTTMTTSVATCPAVADPCSPQ